MVDLAHFFCFLLNSGNDTAGTGSANISSGDSSVLVYVNASAVGMPQNDACGCSPGEGWSMVAGACTLLGGGLSPANKFRP